VPANTDGLLEVLLCSRGEDLQGILDDDVRGRRWRQTIKKFLTEILKTALKSIFI
jgi:hypothetical protein